MVTPLISQRLRLPLSNLFAAVAVLATDVGLALSIPESEAALERLVFRAAASAVTTSSEPADFPVRRARPAVLRMIVPS